MKSRSFVFTVSLIAMMVAGGANAAEIASTSYVDAESDLVWGAIDTINSNVLGIELDENDVVTKIGLLEDAKAYADDEISAAIQELADTIPTNNSQLENGKGYITSAALSDLATKGELSSGLSGKMDNGAAVEMSQVTGLEEALANAGSKPDAELNADSTNSVQNKAVVAALANKANVSDLPTVNDATLTIKRNGEVVGTFTANDAASKEINIVDNDTVYTLPAATADTLGGVMVDTALNEDSTNPVQNKAVVTALNLKADASALDGKMDKVTLATVATSGSYDDLKNKPTIPTYSAGTGLSLNGTTFSANVASAETAGIMKWGQVPSGSADSNIAATIWVQ